MIDPEQKREMWHEGLRVAVRCMTETPFTGYSGEYVTMPPRNVVPKPRAEAAPAAVGRVQPPRHDPPRRAEGHRRARVRVHRSRGGEHWVDDYDATLAEQGVPIGDAVNPNVACVTPIMCHDDEDDALERGIEGANFFGYSLAHYYVFGQHRPGATTCGRSSSSAGPSRATTPRRCSPPRRTRSGSAPRSSQEGVGGLRGAVGTPDQIREYLRRYEEGGVDQVIFCSQAGKNRHEHIMESLELFGREVLPEFEERDEKLHARQGAAARAGDREGHGPQAGRGSPAAPERRTTRSPRSRAPWPTGSATTTSTRCWTRSPSSPRSARAASRR